MYRSRIDIYTNLCKHDVRRRRSRAVSRIPTAQIKRVLQKSKKVIVKMQKHIRKVVPRSSKLHSYLSSKSSTLYHRLNNEFFAISDHMHKLSKKQKLNFNKKHYRSRYHCFAELEGSCLLFIQARTPKHKKSVAYVYTEEHGYVQRNCSALVYKYSGLLIV